MFLTPLKTLLVTAIRNTFDEAYPVEEWQNLAAGIEYPIERDAYPSIWVDFEPVDEIQTVGVGSFFTSPVVNGNSYTYLKWKYQGNATFTIVALSSWERDRIFDEMVSVLAFGRMNPAQSVFRQTIVDNEFIAAQFDGDEIAIRGFAQNPGTPWGSEEIIYEVTLGIRLIGEFNSDVDSTSLVPLSAIDITATPEA
jgi:hypothetical protein